MVSPTILLMRVDRFLRNPQPLAKSYNWLYWRIYNLNWEKFLPLLDNRISQLAPLSSIVGYLIYLNDILTEHMGFNLVTGSEASTLGLSFRNKLILIYIGLLLIAIGRFLFLWRRPNVIRFGPSREQWCDHAMKTLTAQDFFSFHQDIRQNGHRTLYGKYNDNDWTAFWEDANWKMSSVMDPSNDTSLRTSYNEQLRESRKHVDYYAARLRHESLLRSILIDRYDELAASHKLGLILSILFSSVGFVFFLLPNFDLLLTVISSIL